jgi:putative pyruvate formate lyase activating enzyme
MLRACQLCPMSCGCDRLAGRLGRCRTGRLARITSCGPHFGEEAPLVGRRGSGTIFFTFCNLRCVFCQNHEISALGEGTEVSALELASMMLGLQETGCENVNLVSPTHVVPQILEALAIAAEAGLRLPLVYNTGGYDALPTLQLLDGVVDIYMPDIKWADEPTGRKYSRVPGYPAANRAALREMHRQIGDLATDEDGVAVRGLLVRHLVMPNRLAGTAETVRFLATELSPQTYLNVMAQYRPCYLAARHPEIARPLEPGEHQEAVELAHAAGLHRLDNRLRRFAFL